MLKNLNIYNFIIIKESSIEFNKNLNVITGETGAGKSIIFLALNCLLGNNFNEDMILEGEDHMFIEAVFDVSKMTLPTFITDIISEDNMLVISRKFSRGKKKVSKINMNTVSVSFLKQVMKYLINIVSQHDHLNIIDSAYQLSLIDNFDSSSINLLLKKYSDYYRQFIEKKDEFNKLKDSKINDDQSKAFLEFQIKDIETQDFKLGEDDELENKKDQLKHHDDLKTYLISLESELKIAINAINKSLKEYNALSSINSDFLKDSKELEQYLLVLEDKLFNVKENLLNLTHHNDLTLDDIESRLDTIYKYKTKYKLFTIKELISFKDSLIQKLHLIDNKDEILGKISKEIDELKLIIINIAKELNKNRLNNITKLEKLIINNLKDLGFEHCEFKVNCDFDTENLGPKGADSIRFMISTNAGYNLKPIDQIASGGELSRLLLAIKSSYLSTDISPTLLFDEIDTGVGGVIANSIGEKLSIISKNQQVLCITHLAQIAQFSDHHFFVSKALKDKKSISQISLLKGVSRKEELHRMVGGESILDLIHA